MSTMKSPYEAYTARSAMKPNQGVASDLISNVRSQGETTSELFSMCLQMLNDHALHIDRLKLQLHETNEFMKWVSETHQEAFSEYKAIRDLTVASGGANSTLTNMLKEWGEA